MIIPSKQSFPQKVARRWHRADKIGYARIICTTAFLATVVGYASVKAMDRFLDPPELTVDSNNCLVGAFGKNARKISVVHTEHNTVVTGSLRDGQRVTLSSDFNAIGASLVTENGKPLRNTPQTRQLDSDVRTACVRGYRARAPRTSEDLG